MSIRAMFVGNAPAHTAQGGLPAAQKETVDRGAAQRAEQVLLRAMLGEEQPPSDPAGAQPAPEPPTRD